MKMFKALSELTYLEMADLFKAIGVDISVSTIRRRAKEGEFMNLRECAKLIKHLHSAEGAELKMVIDDNIEELRVVMNMLSNAVSDESSDDLLDLLGSSLSDTPLEDDDLFDDDFLEDGDSDEVEETEDDDDLFGDDFLEDGDPDEVEETEEDDDLFGDDFLDDDTSDEVEEVEEDDDLFGDDFLDEAEEEEDDLFDDGFLEDDNDEPWSGLGGGKVKGGKKVKDSFEKSGMDDDEWDSDNHEFGDSFDAKV